MLKFLDHLEEWLIAFLMGAATLLDLRRRRPSLRRRLADPGRAGLAAVKIDLSWAQELCIYMFVWMAKFGAAYGVRTGIHVGVDVLINRLPGRERARLRRCSACWPARLFTGIVGTLGAQVHVWDDRRIPSPTVARPGDADVDRLPVRSRCGSYLMCFRFLQVPGSFAQDR